MVFFFFLEMRIWNMWCVDDLIPNPWYRHLPKIIARVIVFAPKRTTKKHFWQKVTSDIYFRKVMIWKWKEYIPVQDYQDIVIHLSNTGGAAGIHCSGERICYNWQLLVVHYTTVAFMARRKPFLKGQYMHVPGTLCRFATQSSNSPSVVIKVLQMSNVTWTTFDFRNSPL